MEIACTTHQREIFFVINPKIKKPRKKKTPAALVQAGSHVSSHHRHSNEDSCIKLAVSEKAPNLKARPYLIQKFLQPINYHLIYGDILIFDNVNYQKDKQFNTGHISSLFYYKSIPQINHFVEERSLTISLAPALDECPGNWRLLIDRLNSLGNSEAKHLGENIKSYCENFENKILKLFYSSRFLEALPKFKNFNDYTEYKSSILKKYRDLPYFGFERSSKILAGDMKQSEVLLSEKFLQVMDSDVMSFFHLVLKNGIPEFACPDTYYEHWSNFLKTASSTKSMGNYPIRLLTTKGRKKDAFLKQIISTTCVVEDKLMGLVLFEVSGDFMYLEDDGSNSSLTDMDEMGHFKDLRKKQKENLNDFIELYYPKFYKSQDKEKNKNKVCLWRSIE